MTLARIIEDQNERDKYRARFGLKRDDSRSDGVESRRLVAGDRRDGGHIGRHRQTSRLFCAQAWLIQWIIRSERNLSEVTRGVCARHKPGMTRW